MTCKLDTNFCSMMIKILLVCLTLSAWCKVDAKIRLSKEEELEIRSQLKVLNKPPIQSFTKDDGSIIDCIDMYKQPAFDHPLLKNHKLQMRPSPELEKLALSPNVQEPDTLHEPQSPAQYECPSGTVPIRRTRRRDLNAAKSALNHYRTMLRGPSDGLDGTTSYAGGSTLEGPPNLYPGAKVQNSLWDLTMMIPAQTSTASLRIGTGVDGAYSSIEYGWTCDQQLYGDRKPRTFSLWTADGFQNTGCFNTLCPGFVQVSKNHTMGAEITDFSQYKNHSARKTMYYQILKDPKVHDWWLIEVLPGETISQFVGYWPKELFPNMAEFASNVQAGGKVFNPSLEPSKAPMGSGHYVDEDLGQTADIILDVVNSTYNFIDDLKMMVVANTPDFYKAQFIGSHQIAYGGPDFPANSTTT